MNMKMNFSMDEIRLKVEEYIKKGSRAAGRPVLTAYYVLTADSTPESERTNIMIALVALCVYAWNILLAYLCLKFYDEPVR